MKTSISILKSNKSREETIKELNNTNTDYIHVDVMDGLFVQNKSLSIEEVYKINSLSDKPLDIHLMVESPSSYIEAFKDLNAEFITIHAELNNTSDYIDLIHKYGKKAGIAINPETNVDDVENLDKVEYVLIMGVNPGEGGQSLIKEMSIKIDELFTLKQERDYHYEISFDGGVNAQTKDMLFGLDIIVSGSFVCLSDNYQKQIDLLR